MIKLWKMVIKILIALKQIILHYLWTLTNCNVIYYPKNYYLRGRERVGWRLNIFQFLSKPILSLELIRKTPQSHPHIPLSSFFFFNFCAVPNYLLEIKWTLSRSSMQDFYCREKEGEDKSKKSCSLHIYENYMTP